MYGHFPNRRALASALLLERHDSLFEPGDRLPARESPMQALTTWMHAVVVHAAADRELAMLANGLDDEASELHADCEGMAIISERLVATARES
jgi:hypothetical protein